jgi:hypothetical protein
LEEQIAVARSVVVLWSRASVASDWVKNEAREANKRQILIPALIEPVKLPMEFSHIQTADLTAWKVGAASGEFDKLLRGLRGVLGGTEAPSNDHSVVESAQTHEASRAVKTQPKGSPAYGAATLQFPKPAMLAR